MRRVDMLCVHLVGVVVQLAGDGAPLVVIWRVGCAILSFHINIFRATQN